MVDHDIKDLKLAKEGKLRIEWAGSSMPVLDLIRQRFRKVKPFTNLTIGACLHVTAETANLMICLKDGGAKLYLCASNPLSTQDDVAASLVSDFGISVYAIRGENSKTYYKHIEKVLDKNLQITMDDGADLVSELHKNRKNQIKSIIGSSEETTTGVIRLKAMEKDKALKLPVVAVNDSQTKHFFDNRYGTGQSTIDGIMRATNVLLAGRKFVIAGYGYCGRGLASRARGMGAQVIICEVDQVRALEAHMDGFLVMPMDKAAQIGDIFVTATGCKGVLTVKHLGQMKDKAIVANTGHFNVEIEIDKLEKTALTKRQIRPYVTEYTLARPTSNLVRTTVPVVSENRKIFVLAQGRLINLAAAEGHPADVMDMSFANQALACEWLINNKGKLENKVYTIPEKLDKEIARLKLEALGVQIDKLTKEQVNYLSSWQEGT